MLAAKSLTRGPWKKKGTHHHVGPRGSMSHGDNCLSCTSNKNCMLLENGKRGLSVFVRPILLEGRTMLQPAEAIAKLDEISSICKIEVDTSIFNQTRSDEELIALLQEYHPHLLGTEDKARMIEIRR